MIRIAIVEDEQSSEQHLRDLLNRYAKEKKLSFHIQHFPDGAAFLDQYQCNFDIVFLDIEMPFINGMEAAHRLRKMDENVCLIFATNIAQYALEGYSVQASSFFVKPVGYYQLSVVLQRALRQIIRTKGNQIMLNSQQGLQRVDVAAILYVEVRDHALHYHLTDREIIVRGTIKSAEKQLEPLGFAKCSNSFLVNLAYVKGTDANQVYIHVTHDQALTFSRSRKKEFLRKLADYLGGTV